MVAPGLFRGQGWFRGDVGDRPNTGSGAEVERRQAQNGTQADYPLSIKARQQDVTHKNMVRLDREDLSVLFPGSIPIAQPGQRSPEPYAGIEASPVGPWRVRGLSCERTHRRP